MLGITTGMRMYEYWIALFEENERLYKLHQPTATDMEIAECVYNEFPGCAVKLKWVGGRRKRYNDGLMYKGMKPPKVKSQRYGLRGQVVNIKSRRELNEESLTGR